MNEAVEMPKFVSSSIFRVRNLHILERLVKCLKEEFNLTYHEIAILLNRNDRTIWTSYNRAKSKAVRNLPKEEDVLIPLEVFRDRSVSVLESMIRYMKEELNLRYHEMAILLNRNDRTVWTVYNRVKRKLKDKTNK